MSTESERRAAAELRAAVYTEAGLRAGRPLTQRDMFALNDRSKLWGQFGHLNRTMAFPGGETWRETGGFKASLRGTTDKSDGSDRFHVDGVASVTDKPYEMYDWAGEYEEIIERGAFTDTLAADPDVCFLVNHKGLSMARTKSGTLQLSMVDEGLGQEAWLNPERADVADLRAAMDDGDIDEMSFAFRIEEGWWSDDFMTFKISKIDLNRGDVSAVNYGANPYTSISARTVPDLERLPAGAGAAAVRLLSQRVDVSRLLRRAQAADFLDEQADEAAHIVASQARKRSAVADIANELDKPTGHSAAGMSTMTLQAMLTLEEDD